MPSYKTTRSPFAAPHVWVRLTDNTKTQALALFGAIVDSGADYTCVPRNIFANVPELNYEIDLASDFDGNPVQLKLVRILDATVELLDDNQNIILTRSILNLRLPIVAQGGLLGRDILNQTVCTLDGPSLLCDVR